MCVCASMWGFQYSKNIKRAHFFVFYDIICTQTNKWTPRRNLPDWSWPCCGPVVAVIQSAFQQNSERSAQVGLGCIAGSRASANPLCTIDAVHWLTLWLGAQCTGQDVDTCWSDGEGLRRFSNVTMLFIYNR